MESTTKTVLLSRREQLEMPLLRLKLRHWLAVKWKLLRAAYVRRGNRCASQ